MIGWPDKHYAETMPSRTLQDMVRCYRFLPEAPMGRAMRKRMRSFSRGLGRVLEIYPSSVSRSTLFRSALRQRSTRDGVRQHWMHVGGYMRTSLIAAEREQEEKTSN